MCVASAGGLLEWQNVFLSKNVAIKLKTGQEEFLGGKLAVPNGRGTRFCLTEGRR